MPAMEQEETRYAALEPTVHMSIKFSLPVVNYALFSLFHSKAAAEKSQKWHTASDDKNYTRFNSITIKQRLFSISAHW